MGKDQKLQCYELFLTTIAPVIQTVRFRAIEQGGVLEVCVCVCEREKDRY